MYLGIAINQFSFQTVDAFETILSVQNINVFLR